MALEKCPTCGARPVFGLAGHVCKDVWRAYVETDSAAATAPAPDLYLPDWFEVRGNDEGEAIESAASKWHDSEDPETFTVFVERNGKVFRASVEVIYQKAFSVDMPDDVTPELSPPEEDESGEDEATEAAPVAVLGEGTPDPKAPSPSP